ncbi:stress-response A/B barrel domain-containing protein UP3-like [Glycine soja]|nr:stress-response A/B barrel domain-containing protein UP3 [Glycine max]XP_028201735.1 stress-response A/B barrel domain-containing protein UP3-like [Glycine soja]|eukprot:XP_006598405.1 stress-response A/B barrel domain-containing protein UP3 [Glycine max]
MVVDWVAGGVNLPPLAKGSALRVSFLKLKESIYEEVKDEALSVVRGMEHGVAGVLWQFSYDENFSPERAKGFTLASLAVFPEREELQSVELDEGLGVVVEDVVVVDYVVP